MCLHQHFPIQALIRTAQQDEYPVDPTCDKSDGRWRQLRDHRAATADGLISLSRAKPTAGAESRYEFFAQKPGGRAGFRISTHSSKTDRPSRCPRRERLPMMAGASRSSTCTVWSISASMMGAERSLGEGQVT